MIWISKGEPAFGKDLLPRNKKERWVKIYKSQKKGGNKTVGSVKPRRNDSPIWSGLLKIKHIYPKGEENEINSGGYVLVRRLVSESPHCAQYPVIFKSNM